MHAHSLWFCSREQLVGFCPNLTNLECVDQCAWLDALIIIIIDPQPRCTTSHHITSHHITSHHITSHHSLEGMQGLAAAAATRPLAHHGSGKPCPDPAGPGTGEQPCQQVGGRQATSTYKYTLNDMACPHGAYSTTKSTLSPHPS
jgi:hypothetical protein